MQKMYWWGGWCRGGVKARGFLSSMHRGCSDRIAEVKWVQAERTWSSLPRSHIGRITEAEVDITWGVPGPSA